MMLVSLQCPCCCRHHGSSTSTTRAGSSPPANSCCWHWHVCKDHRERCATCWRRRLSPVAEFLGQFGQFGLQFVGLSRCRLVLITFLNIQSSRPFKLMCAYATCPAALLANPAVTSSFAVRPVRLIPEKVYTQIVTPNLL
mmetsp:Transcript_82165/g.241235  ORF Transcript_82165/g.241235 Transcript_82165/m.241235 type:complete len:140 (-) Transcript_82165:645-1064(-)